MTCLDGVATQAYVDEKVREILQKIGNTDKYLLKTEAKPLIDATIAGAGLVTVGMMTQGDKVTAEFARLLAQQNSDKAQEALRKAQEALNEANKKIAQAELDILKQQLQSDYNAKINTVDNTANTAKRRAEFAIDSVDEALVKAERAAQQATEAKSIGSQALNLAKNLDSKVISISNKASEALAKANRFLAELPGIKQSIAGANKLAGEAKSLADSLSGKVARVLDELPGLKSALNGAKEIGEKALKTALVALSFIDVIFAIVNQGTINQLAHRIDLLENSIGLLGADVSRALGLIQTLKSRTDRLINEFEAFVKGTAVNVYTLFSEISGLRSNFTSLSSALNNKIDSFNGAINLANERSSLALINALNAIGLATTALTVGNTAISLINGLRPTVSTHTSQINNLLSGGKTRVVTNNYYITQPVKETVRERVVPVPVTNTYRSYTNSITNNNTIIERQPIINNVTNNKTNNTVIRQIVNPNDSAILKRIDNNTTTNLIYTVGQSANINWLRTVTQTTWLNGYYKWFTSSNFAGKFTQMFTNLVNPLNKARELINTALIFHNATMLSRDIGYTLGFILDSVTSAFGMKWTDINGNETTISQAIGKEVKDHFIELIGGQEAWQNLSLQWFKLSTIYNAAINVWYNVQGMITTVQNVINTVGEYTGKIGNALKASAVIRENSFAWMNTDFPTDLNESRFSRFFKTVEDIQDATGAMASVTSDVISVKDQLTQLQQTENQINQEIADRVTTTTTNANEAKIDSEAPETLETANLDAYNVN